MVSHEAFSHSLRPRSFREHHWNLITNMQLLLSAPTCTHFSGSGIDSGMETVLRKLSVSDRMLYQLHAQSPAYCLHLATSLSVSLLLSLSAASHNIKTSVPGQLIPINLFSYLTC